jgi:hypothetical protein
MNIEDLKKLLKLTTDRKELKIYRGSVLEEPNMLYDGTIGKMGFKYIDGFLCEPYLMVWINPKELAILSYCEGDITLTESNNKENFNVEVKGHLECLGSQFDGEPEKEILEIINEG